MLSLALPIACCAPEAPPEVTSIPAQGMPYVCQVVDTHGFGTAVAFTWANGYQWYLTAKHCMPFDTIDGRAVLYIVPHPDPGVDVALVAALSDTPIFHKLSFIAPEMGDRLLSFGKHFKLITGAFRRIVFFMSM